MTSIRLLMAGNTAAFAIAIGSHAFAADYYFDSVGGDDAKDGQTEATAKKTLKLPSGNGNTVHLKRGSSWTLNLSANNVTVTTYGEGDRPSIIGTLSVSKSTVEGLAVRPPAGGTKAVNCINVMSDSILKDCEADGGGTADFMINVGIGVMGQNNRILGNYVHDLAWSQSGGQMDNSGGAEGIMVMASNNEIAFNSAVRCSSQNSTLGGFEGGCYEIVNGKAGSTISNVSFHHNYCEQSIGTWEGCSGDFSASGGGIQENHGIIENVTVSYNLSVDSMWLFLLQPVNTDFKNVVFANNALIHTAKSKEYWDNSPFHYSMGNAVATYTNSSTNTTYDTDNEFYKKGSGFQPGTIIVKNNIFMDDVGTTRYQMFSTNFADHSNNLFIPSNASIGSITLNSTEKKVNVADMAFTADWRLTANSTPALDTGLAVSMNDSVAMAASTLDPSFFPDVFTKDIDNHPVPCGAGVDIGPSEYCANMGGASSAGGALGFGGSSAVAKAGSPSVTAGGKAAVGGAAGIVAKSGGAAAVVAGTGGASAARPGPGAAGRASGASGATSRPNATGGNGLGATTAPTTASTNASGGSNATAQSTPGTPSVGSAPSSSTSSVAQTANGGSTTGSGDSSSSSIATANGTKALGAAGTGPGAGDSGGCNCRVAEQSRSSGWGSLAALGCAMLVLRRRRG